MTLTPVDRLEATIVVDNATDGLSTTPSFVESEFNGLWRAGKLRMSGQCLCCAAHGLSCLIRVERGAVARSLLFDAGPDEDVFELNADRLDVDLGAVEAVVLSHGHWDHAGGMLRALDLMRSAKAGERPYYAHPGMYRTRAMKMSDGRMREMDDVPGPQALAARGARVVNATEPQLILEDMVWISGEIPRVTPFEQGLPGQHRRTEDGLGWEPDPLLTDERFVAVNVAGKGLVVFTACSHAGVVNVLEHARAGFPDVPLHAVLGGLHLSGANEKIIPETVGALGAFGLKTIAAGHCTGWRALVALANAFGDDVVAPLAVGKRYRF